MSYYVYIVLLIGSLVSCSESSRHFPRYEDFPEEKVSADCFRFISKDSIWTLDANKMRTTRWKIEQNANKIVPVEYVDMDKRLVRALDFYPMESGFLVADYLGEYRQKWTDRQGRWIHSTNQIPSTQEYSETSRPALAQAWRSFFDYNPRKKIIAMATQLGEVLEIYNLKDSSQIIKYGPQRQPVAVPVHLSTSIPPNRGRPFK